MRSTEIDILLIDAKRSDILRNIPWSVLSVASCLNQRGYSVEMIDTNACNEVEFQQELNSYIGKTKLIGLSCMTSDTNWVRGVVDYIKEVSPSTFTIVGGPHARLLPEQTCKYKNIDFVAHGEGELTAMRLIDEMKKEEPNYENVPGLVYDNGTERTPSASPVGFYDANYELLTRKSRDTYGTYIQVLTGRGCSYRCTFCYNSVIKQNFRPRPIEDVVEEINKVVAEYNPHTIFLRSENFFHNKQRVLDFIRLYKENKFTFEWRTTCRANYFRDDYINDEFIKELESINCQCLKVGIEAGSQRVLDYLNKRITVEDIKRCNRTISKTNIQGDYLCMIGLPTQSFSEYVDTMDIIRYILKNEPTADICGPQYYRTYPGGELYDEIKEKYGFAEPSSFEMWADTRGHDIKNPFRVDRKKEYPWVPKEGKHLALHATALVLLARKPFSDYKSIKKMWAIPFAVLGKLRMKYSYYKHLYDVRFLVWLYNKYSKYDKTAMPLSQ